jgi:two-component system, OmpR family, sensor histidine kinase KdpD
MKITPPEFRRAAFQIATGLTGIAVITAVCFRAGRLVIPSFLYLLVVLAESLWGSFAGAAIVSVAATACLEYFFIPPVLEWQIDDPEDYLVLLTYLVTSLVITRLASKARSEARIAERGRKDVTLLYTAASRLLSLEPEMAAGPESPRVFREVFGLRAVCLFDEASGRLQIDGESRCGLAEKTRRACAADASYQDPGKELYVRPLLDGTKITGAAGFEGRIDDDSVALGLSALAATALERIRSYRSAGKAAVDAQAEMLRSAILDAFAHEFKTPLAIILAAAGGLRENTGKQFEQMEMTEIIESQTMRLSQLTTRLLRIARLDRDDVRPMMELTSLHDFLGRLSDHCQTQFGRRITTALGKHAANLMADGELLGLAITQLLDNACKYSRPDTVVMLTMTVDEHYAEIRVINQGSSIRPEEGEFIFERFFRGSATEHIAPGAGLGLYVARKIINAHDGVLELEPSPAELAITAFRMRLPILPEDKTNESKAHQSVGSGR